MKVTKLAQLDARVAGGTDREGGGEGPIVVLLHGFGAPGDDLVPLWRVLAAPPGTRFVFPEAPLDLGERSLGRAWWWIDLEERMRRQASGEKRDTTEVPEGLDAARTELEAFLDALEAALPPSHGKIVLGGFSQGAMLALDVALRSPRPLAGLALLSGTPIASDEWGKYFTRRRGFPIFISHGQNDPILPFELAEELGGTLASHGMAVDWVPFRGGHGIPSNVVDLLGAFLCRVLR